MTKVIIDFIKNEIFVFLIVFFVSLGAPNRAAIDQFIKETEGERIRKDGKNARLGLLSTTISLFQGKYSTLNSFFFCVFQMALMKSMAR